VSWRHLPRRQQGLRQLGNHLPVVCQRSTRRPV
jgi:hypothetical protein